jgi:hypothetical protein
MRSIYAVFAIVLSVWVPMSGRCEPLWRGVNVPQSVAEKDVLELSRWNVNVVRFVLAWNDTVHTASESEYNDWLSGALVDLDRSLPLFRKAQIRVIVDLHTPPGGLISKSHPKQSRLFTESWPQESIVKIWRRIARRYRGNRTILGFDLLNEPAQSFTSPGLKNWNELAEEITAAIRQVDSKRTVIVESVHGHQTRISRLKPIPFDNVVYSVHAYYPLRFNHQGIGHFRPGISYPQKKLNRKKLRRKLIRVKRFQRKHNVPIYIGEFSAVRWAPGQSSYLYLRDLIKLFERHKWHWTYHAYRESHVWSVEHSSDPDNYERVPHTDRKGLLLNHFSRNSSIRP